jgi:hypothetical protein
MSGASQGQTHVVAMLASAGADVNVVSSVSRSILRQNLTIFVGMCSMILTILANNRTHTFHLTFIHAEEQDCHLGGSAAPSRERDGSDHPIFFNSTR